MAQETTNIFTPIEGGVRVNVRVKIGGRVDRILGVDTDANGQERLKILTNQPLEKGRANKGIILVLASALSVPKTSLTLIKGHKDRNKVVLVSGHPDWIVPRLERVMRLIEDEQ